MPANAIVRPRVFPQSLSTSASFNSPGVSLALRSNLEGRREALSRMAEAFEPNLGRRSREELEYESRSGSENIDGGSGDDQDDTNGYPPRKKRHHRHNPQQIQELELVFKECPHPDEKQRLELGSKLGLESRQVKFWFQNRRTQMKTQLGRHEHALLRQENDKLRSENLSIRDAMRNPICSNCGGPAMIGEISVEEQQHRIQNAQLKDEIHRAFFLAGRFLGRPISSLGTSVATPLPGSNLDVRVGMNGFGGLTRPAVVPRGPDSVVGNFHRPVERSIFLELGLAAMDELVKKAHADEPLWTRNSDAGREILNQEEYIRMFTPCIGFKPNGFASEASRQSSVVIVNCVALVEALMDSKRWAEMFPGLIARATTTDVISSGVGGTRNCALQLMEAEFQVVSPFVPVREVSFLRFCKQHADGVWAVVDVSIESMNEAYPKSRRLPSGCVVQPMPNGFSKVTWVEHAEYEESQIHHLYRPLVSSGMGFGAPRWVAALQRQCQFLSILLSPSLRPPDHAAITPAGRRSMLKLAHMMTQNFCAGVCASTMHIWNKLYAGNVDENIRVVTRKSVNNSGEPPSILLGAATSVSLPVPPRRLFAFLCDQRQRSEWDVLSNGGPMQEMTHIAKGHDLGNSVSLLRANAVNANQSTMLLLQETCSDAAGSLIVYAPVDIPAMHLVLNGGDLSSATLPPSGFAIVADGRVSGGQTEGNESGSLLTVAFQILVNSLPTGNLTVESVNNLISSTIHKIKAALARREH